MAKQFQRLQLRKKMAGVLIWNWKHGKEAIGQLVDKVTWFFNTRGQLQHRARPESFTSSPKVNKPPQR